MAKATTLNAPVPQNTLLLKFEDPGEVVLRMSFVEAAFLASLLNGISGDRDNAVRGHADSIRNALISANVPAFMSSSISGARTLNIPACRPKDEFEDQVVRDARGLK